MKKKRLRLYLFILMMLVLTGGACILLFVPSFPSMLSREWNSLTHESKRFLGWENKEIPEVEKKIREEIILKKMEEVAAQRDWRDLAPEYPRRKKIEAPNEAERMKLFRNTPEYREIEQELQAYLKTREEQLYPEAPAPSLKDAIKLVPQEDRTTEKIIERLQRSKGGETKEKPLEENLLLGIKGPPLYRKILTRPRLPQMNIKAETEIELTFWVLPNGSVGRVAPSVKGDLEMERVAVQYLSQWQFEPLPKDKPQVEQKGTLPIKFRLP